MAAAVYVVERRRGTGVLAAVVGSTVGSVALAGLLWVLATPAHPSELGAYHDPNAGAQPIIAMAGWFLGGFLGVIVALVALGYKRVERAAIVVLVLDLVAAPILAVLAAFLIPFGGAPVLVPILVGWTIVVPGFARAVTRPPVLGSAIAIALAGRQDPLAGRAGAQRDALARRRTAGRGRTPSAGAGATGALAPPRLGGVEPGRPASEGALPPGPPVDASLPVVVVPVPSVPPPSSPPPTSPAPGSAGDTSAGRHT
ncbi:MAG: hypothetical protein U0P45_06825 [Acidimicrobiales bacterium]